MPKPDKTFWLSALQGIRTLTSYGGYRCNWKKWAREVLERARNFTGQPVPLESTPTEGDEQKLSEILRELNVEQGGCEVDALDLIYHRLEANQIEVDHNFHLITFFLLYRLLEGFGPEESWYQSRGRGRFPSPELSQWVQEIREKACSWVNESENEDEQRFLLFIGRFPEIYRGLTAEQSQHLSSRLFWMTWISQSVSAAIREQFTRTFGFPDLIHDLGGGRVMPTCVFNIENSYSEEARDSEEDDEDGSDVGQTTEQTATEQHDKVPDLHIGARNCSDRMGGRDENPAKFDLDPPGGAEEPVAYPVPASNLLLHYKSKIWGEVAQWLQSTNRLEEKHETVRSFCNDLAHAPAFGGLGYLFGE